MADETKNTKETDETLTDEETLEKIEGEIDTKLVETVDGILNPAEDEDKAKEETKEGTKEEKSAEETKEDKEETVEDEDKSTQNKEDDSESTKTVASLNLPNRLIQAAKRNHLSDEEVLKLGDKVELVLSKMADKDDSVSEYLGKIGREAKSKFVAPKKEEVKTPTLKLPEDFDSEAGKQLQETIAALTAKITNLEKELSVRDEKSTLTAQLEQDKKIDGFFDKVSSDYPEFGNSSKLTNAELVMRQNVWEKADDILAGARINGQEVPLNDALEQAMSIYEGKHPSKVREKVVKEVKEREKQLISRPTSKRQSRGEVKGDEAAVKAVQEILDRGKEGW